LALATPVKENSVAMTTVPSVAKKANALTHA
jgi:hypothetical protein